MEVLDDITAQNRANLLPQYRKTYVDVGVLDKVPMRS